MSGKGVSSLQIAITQDERNPLAVQVVEKATRALTQWPLDIHVVRGIVLRGIDKMFTDLYAAARSFDFKGEVVVFDALSYPDFDVAIFANACLHLTDCKIRRMPGATIFSASMFAGYYPEGVRYCLMPPVEYLKYTDLGDTRSTNEAMTQKTGEVILDKATGQLRFIFESVNAAQTPMRHVDEALIEKYLGPASSD